MAQETQTGALYDSRGGGMGWEMGGKFRKEEIYSVPMADSC